MSRHSAPARLCARGRPDPLLGLGAGALLLLAACNSESGAETPGVNPFNARPVAGPLAFPGAVGFGAGSRGGRGGKIIEVTTLADSGEGSLRACIQEKTPRVCVFRVAGVIRFSGRPPIIRSPYLTIAGQTAPAPGITLAHSGGPEGRTPLLIKNTHDVVIRHIRVRNDRLGESRGSEDSFTIETSDNVILDHVSGSWARDEIVNGYGDNDRITISNSIFAEGIPRHDKCALLASDPKAAQRLSFIGNLCAHNGDRNPDINFPPGSCVEVVNNVLYNAQSEFAEVWESFGGSPVSIVGNSFIAGPDTSKKAIGIALNRPGSTGNASVYQAHNTFEGDFTHVGAEIATVAADSPPCPLTLQPLSATMAFTRVLAEAGAWPRDSFDGRIVQNVRKRSGKIVAAPGPIPADAQSGANMASPYPDIDRDGMDDRWEEVNGANPYQPDAWADPDDDGVAQMDEFLEYLHRRRMRGAAEG
ncbi:pectate lyase family protein [Novosphingobium sp. M1R2S20]|uniref:Polysaccharide lyase family 1 protein n=1 Tax=Novosphingobium rhizovicinum TaxID=3228928 RepID=A0ABV3RII0_9SPHN